MKKEHLPSKICPVCGFSFNWRKNGKKHGKMLNIVVKNVDATKPNLKNEL